MDGPLSLGSGLILLGLAVLGLLAGRLVPRTVVLLWALILVLVPYWVAVGGAVLVPVCVLASAATAAATVRRWSVPRPVDAAVAAFVVLLLLAAVSGAGRAQEVLTFVLGPFAAYAAGRTVSSAVPLRWLYGVLGGLFAVVAVLAIVESRTGFNPFLDLGPRNALAEIWAEQRFRGGQVRPETSFGSSIAMGACIAMTVPLVWAARWPARWRAVVVVVLVIASMLSLSRIAMATTLLAVVLMAVLSRHRFPPRRTVLLALLAVPVGLEVAVSLRAVFEAAGAEAADSAAYRDGLTQLMPSMRLLGLADSVFIRADGVRYFGPFRSIDSQLILMGLLHGILPLLVLLLPLAVAVVLVVTGRASTPVIAVVCQLPALANVALITQYETYFWFMVGLAATVPTARREAALIRRDETVPRAAAPNRSVVSTHPALETSS